MMLKKQWFKTKCKVAFEIKAGELPKDIKIQSIHLVGEFNGWDKTATPLRKVKNVWKEFVIIDLEKELQYRFLINGTTWFNDPNADKYVANNVDGDNCIVSTFQAQ